MKLIIAGGRDFFNYKLLEAETKKFIMENYSYFNNGIDSRPKIQIISGKANGADSLGEWFAKDWKFELIEMPAKWDDIDHPKAKVKHKRNGGKYNAAAGPIRNEEMAKIATHAIIFWDGQSSGSKNMIENAKKYNLIYKVINY